MKPILHYTSALLIVFLLGATAASGQSSFPSRWDQHHDSDRGEKRGERGWGDHWDRDDRRWPPRPRPGRGDILFFEDSELRGEALVFHGPHSIPRLDEYYSGPLSWNDQISSVAINGPYQVILFEHAYYQGRSVLLDASTFNVTQLLDGHGHYENWNDRVSSMKILPKRGGHRPGPEPDRPRPGLPAGELFEHSDFRGESLALFQGQEIRNLGAIDWNDRTSSMQIKPGFVMILYEHADFRGQSIRLDHQQHNLGSPRGVHGHFAGWNDRASSLKIIRIE